MTRDKSSSQPKQGESQSEVSTRRRVASPNDTVAAVTDIGRTRDHNEDAFYVSDDGRVLMVADGMGGHAGGEVAAALAVETLTEFLSAQFMGALEANPERMKETLVEGLLKAHGRILGESQRHEELPGMGTTFIVGCVLGDRLSTCHVGDVRGYVGPASKLKQIIKDHSVVADLVRTGMLTNEEARLHPLRSQILQALGLPSGIAPESNTQRLVEGDYVLLCSDGLPGDVSDHEIRATLATDGLVQDHAMQLVDRAIAAGGNDNITVALYRHQAIGRRESAST